MPTLRFVPRVSVIIPAHNAAAYLPEALASVEAQTYVDWEIVAVDDGSSDETWALLDGAGVTGESLAQPGRHRACRSAQPCPRPSQRGTGRLPGCR